MHESAENRIQQVFLAALEIPEEDRAAWLAKECGDDQDLLENVRSLLDHDEPAVDPLERGVEVAITEFPHTEVHSATDEPPKEEPVIVVDCDHFLAKLSEVGVLSPDEFDSVSETLSSDASSADPRQLASQLVTDGKLTEYQASALLKGKPELLIDKYLILDLIDVGGMGMVFKAIHRTMNRVVALKMMSQKMLSSPDLIKRFQREVRVAATLEHPNIVRSYDADQARGVHFLVMEFVRGENLDNAVRETGPLSLEKATDCIRQAAEGLRHAHERGIIHRDIKPGNLILSDDGTVKLLDLGLAHVDESLRVLHQSAVSAEGDAGRPHVSKGELTADGTVLGTVSFMAPEQSLDAGLADSRSDIYSLGCTFFFLLTGEPPYRADSIFNVFLQHRDGNLPSICDKRPDVPEMVETICHKMLAKQPDDRYQSMSDVIEAIEDCKVDAPKKPRRHREDKKRPVTSGDHSTVLATPSDASPHRGPRIAKTAGLWGGLALLIILVAYGGFRIWTANQGGDGNGRVSAGSPDRQKLVTTVEDDEQLAPQEIGDESTMSAADSQATAAASTAGPTSVSRTPLPDGSPGEVAKFNGHTGLVRAVAFSPDGRTVASTSWDGTLRLWDVETKQQIQDFDLPQNGHSLAFSTDGRLVAGNYGNEKIGIWDVKSGRRADLLTGHEGVVRAVAFSPTDDELASGSDDQTINIWDLATGKPKLTLKNHVEEVRDVVYSSDGERIFSSASSHSSNQKPELKLWNTENGEELWSLDTAAGIRCLCLGPDDKTIVYQAWGILAVVYSDLQTTAWRLSPVAASIEGNCLAFHPDGRRVVVGCDDKAIRIMDLVERKEVFQFKADSHVTAHVANSPDGRFLVSAGDRYLKPKTEDGTPREYEDDGDYSVRLWRLPNLESVGSNSNDVNQIDRSARP